MTNQKVLHTVLIQGRDGLFLVNPNDKFIGSAILHYGEYAQYESDLFRQCLQEGDVVVEVGANIGSQTVGLSRMVGNQGRVVAVEPQPIIFQNLCANISLNGRLNVDTFHCALGESAGEVVVPPVDYCQQGNFGNVSVSSDKSRGTPVQLHALDELFLYDRLKLLKVDVEGMELAVLKGATQTIKAHQPYLYLENDRKENSPELVRYVREELGYNAWWHAPTLYNEENFFSNKKNIFGKLQSLNMFCIPGGVKTEMSSFIPVNSAQDWPLTE